MAKIETIFKIAANVTGNSAVKQLSDEIKKISSNGDNLKRSFAQAFRVAVVGATAAAGAVSILSTKAINTADDINDLAQKTGVAVETLSQFYVAAEKSGTSLDGVASSMNKLNKSIVEARSGTGSAAAAFKAMDVNVTNADGTLKKADRVILEIADRFERLEDGPQKAALAMAVFGKSGASIIPFLNQGSEEITRFGLAIDTGFAKAADGFNDRLADMRAGALNFGITAAKIMLPAINDAIDSFGELFEGTGELATPFFKFLADGLRGVSDLIRTLVAEIQIAAAAIKSIGTVAYGVYQVIKGNRDDGIKIINQALNDFDAAKQKNRAKQANAVNDFWDKSYIIGTGGSSTQNDNSVGRRGGNGSMLDYDPKQAGKDDQAARKMADTIEDLQKKIATLDADTAAIRLNTIEREKAKTLAEFEARGIKKNTELYKDLSDAIDRNTKATRSFEAGAYRALNNYLDNATNTAKRTEEVFSRALTSIEDGFVELATTGKVSFKDMARSIIADLIRIQIQQSITVPLAGLLRTGLGSIFSGGAGSADAMVDYMTNPLAGFASGGDHRGGLRIVGENGPELEATGPSRIFSARQTKEILSNAGSGGQTNNVSVVVNMENGTTTSADSDQGRQLGDLIAASVKSILINEKRPGGLIAA